MPIERLPNYLGYHDTILSTPSCSTSNPLVIAVPGRMSPLNPEIPDEPSTREQAQKIVEEIREGNGGITPEQRANADAQLPKAFDNTRRRLGVLLVG